MSKLSKQDQIQELLTRGVAEIIHKPHLENALKSGKKLRVKWGVDPTSPNIHIGRAMALWKLRAFQELGHQVVVIVGDFTGQIGDTSDKDAERPMLTEKTIKENLKNYFSQVYKVLDKSKTEVHYNSKWLKKIGLTELSEIANLFGLHEFEARENISKRMKLGKRVSVRELLYPLMQGYDSVVVKADVELGATDQRYNILAGRIIQKFYNQEQQDILLWELLEGSDGRKMSSSWGNVINIIDSPSDMFGKAMSLSDNLIEKYFILATQVPLDQIADILKSNKNPRDQKLILAEHLVSLYHGPALAEKARTGFIAQFSNKELPQDIEVFSLKPGTYTMADLLVLLKLASSKSEARRLISQGGVKINQKTITDKPIQIAKENNLTVQVGKRKFAQIK